MNVVLSWLRDYCDWDWSTEELVEKLTMAGVEVEEVRETGFSRDGFVAAEVVSFVKHPNADRLRLCQVNDGEGVRQIVCGASNFQEGDIVPLAQPGAVMPAGFKIKASKLRGEKSEGMMCAAEELGLHGPDDGLLLLAKEVAPGTPLKELYEGETVLEIEVTPNRPDLLSYRGLARELIALGAEAKPLPFPETSADYQSDLLSIEVAASELCDRYSAAVISGVEVGQSPEWMKSRLEAQGLRPINVIVDITNYVLMETGQPLHAFDAAKISEGIQVRLAEAGEKILALDGEEYALAADDLVIADGSGPVAIAGVMGGELSGVTEATNEVLLESAYFNPATVRRTSRKLGLISDSSYRFERGVDPAGIDLARKRAISLIEELAGGTLKGEQESGSYDHTVVRLQLRDGSIERLLGYTLSEERVGEILEGLGLSSDGGEWLIPSYRADLVREVDLLEEIARVEGLDQVKGELPAGASSQSTSDQRDQTLSRLRAHLAGLGFSELQTTSFVAKEMAEEGMVCLHNPLNEEAAYLRTSLLQTSLPCVKRNVSQGNLALKLYEIGTVYREKRGHPKEQLKLCLIMSGPDLPTHWQGESEEVGYYHLKGIVENILATLPGVSFPENIGPVPTETLKAHGIKGQVWAVEFDLKGELSPEIKTFSALTPFPAVKRDLAFVVPRQTPHETLEKEIGSLGIRELEEMVCFDVFTDDSGEKLSQDEKSLAYALTYRSPERTLTDKDVNGWEKSIIQAVESKLGGRLR